MHERPYFKYLLRISVLFLALSHSAKAQVYPWVQMDAEDFKMISDPYVESQFRLEMIEKAKNSIDIVVWDQRVDETVGYPILRALRKAADRGVKIRFLLSWSGHLLEDTFNQSGHYLTRPPTQTPIEFQIVGGTSMWRSGWGYLDGIHEKLFIVDNQITLITGRGHADQYLQWMDTAFTFKGPLVEQTVEAFQGLWDIVKRETSKSKSLKRTGSGRRPNEKTDSQGCLNENINSKLNEQLLPLQQWLIDPPKPIPTSSDNSQSKNVLKVRLLHFDLLNQLRKIADREGLNPYEISTRNREFQLEDPIVNEVIRLASAPQTKDLRFYTLSVTLNPILKETLIGGLKRGLSVTFFTNGRKAQKEIAPLSIPVGWYLSLPDMDDLLTNGASGVGLLSSSPDSAVFLHRKMAVIDDTVLAGSHNLNYSSSFESDEINIEVVSPQFANQARALFDESRLKNGEFLDPVSIHTERKRSVVAEWFAEWFKGFY